MEALDQMLVLQERELGGVTRSVVGAAVETEPEASPEVEPATSEESSKPCSRCMPWPFLVV